MEKSDQQKGHMKYSIKKLNRLFTGDVRRLCELYAKTATVPPRDFRERINSLRKFLPRIANIEMEGDYLPFLIVVTNKLVSLKAKAEEMVIDWSSAHIGGGTDRAKNLVKVPKRACYLAVNVEDGTRTRRKYSKSEPDIIAEVPGRSPLNLDEGLALVVKRGGSIGREYGLLLAGSHCTNGWNPDEIAVIYEGSDMYESFVVIEQTYCGKKPPGENEDGWWGTPTCEMRLG